MIQRLCPDVNIAVAHGQMEGEKLEQIMMDFIDHQYDILLTTSIIESGLDISNANTIIINDAQNFGLSDLHQLRGRVGRSNKKAFCYLLTPPMRLLTSEARKRLSALEQFSDLGSGLNIAMRDLDIRGAGNLLGGEQSGFISEIGFEMYQKILNEAIAELKEKEFKEIFAEDDDTKNKLYVNDCQIETDLEILIPDDYINNVTERIFIYKELDDVDNEAALQQFERNLIDRFGALPQATLRLINAIRLRWLAKEIGFEKIVLKNNSMLCYFISKSDSPYFSSDKFGNILNYIKNNPVQCRLKERKERLYLAFADVKGLKQALALLHKMKLA
jgi:transcription-repair coupling factor (superfamily II helicase)